MRRACSRLFSHPESLFKLHNSPDLNPIFSCDSAEKMV